MLCGNVALKAVKSQISSGKLNNTLFWWWWWWWWFFDFGVGVFFR